MSLFQANRFAHGQIAITSGARDVLDDVTVRRALSRHLSGDWGDVDREDWERNDKALICAERLLSVYRSEQGVRFYVITEHNRIATTILLPDEY